MHRHSREDEYSYLVHGRIGGWFEGDEVFAEAAELIHKPRGE